jgi:tetratricopeptide (TPR) repeat protein
VSAERPAGRRRIARLVLALLVLVHVSALLVYERYTRQLAAAQLALDARDEWREGHLDAAAALYARFLDEYAAARWPLQLTRQLPSAASGWFALGRVEAERHRVDAALAAFEHAMRLEPGLGRREYRDLLYESGRYGELERYARRVLAAEPRSLPAILDLGAALYAAGRAGEAALAYERGLSYVAAYLRATDPGFSGRVSVPEATLLNLAAVAHLAAGDRVRAAAACDGLAARMPAHSRLDRLCRAYLEADAGRAGASRAALAGLTPQSPEEEALIGALERRLGS